MSEEVDSITQTCENSLTTLKVEDNPEELPPRVISYTSRRPRFGTGNVPLSPYILIDGKKLRSSLAIIKKSPPRRVSFPTNDNHLVTGYLEPANPWKHAENVHHEDLISAYKESCIKHNTDPLEIVISQLEALDLSNERSEELNLKGQTLDPNHSEPLEEILKRVQFNKINLEGTSLNHESSVILFDMLEYYESAKHLNISSNGDIGILGWQACANMIRKTQCLEHLEAKDVMLNEQYMNILSRALRLVCHLHVLKLEKCGLSGRSLVTLVAALKMNSGLRELYLADNGFDQYDAVQLGSLLRFNNHIQLLDVSNNNIQDGGLHDMLEGLINQINEDKSGKGLNILILWNNQLTKKSSSYFARLIAFSKTLETLNVGKNMLTDELLFGIKEALKKNRVLLQLGIQSTDLTCDGIVTLSEIIEINQVLQRIDLRNNNIEMTGIRALSSAMKKNKSITKVDLDDKTKMETDGTSHQYMQLVAEIRACCTKNEQRHTLEENCEGSENSHHSRFCSINSRKISLTCHTLPCSLPPMISIQNNESGRSMFEPKCINGGRLRSPILSPASSPVASPLPSPSRNRFVVSRVPETSLCSIDSHPELPVTLASFGSSPTCFTSSASGSSRFRVSVVESASTVSLPKSVVASPEVDVTFGLNFKVNTTKSTDTNDTDNVFRSELEINNDQDNENFQNTLSNVSYLISNVVEKTCTQPGQEVANIEELSTNKCLVQAPIKIQPDSSINNITLQSKKYCDIQDNHVNILSPMESTASIKNIKNVQNYYSEATEDVKKSVNINKYDKSSSCIIVNDKPITINKEYNMTKEPANTLLSKKSESQAQTNKNSSAQTHTFNAGKLFSPFQHPNCFFSNFMTINQFECRSIFQDSVSMMIMLGNKFRYYLKEKRDRVHDHGLEKPSIAPKHTSVKTFNIFPLSNLENLTNIFSSFKFDDNLDISKQNYKSYSKAVRELHSLFREECTDDLNGIEKDYAHYRDQNKKVRMNKQKALGNELLPEHAIEKAKKTHLKADVGLVIRDLVLRKKCTISDIEIDTCSKIISNILLTHVVSKSKLSVLLHKLINKLEYFVSKIIENDVKKLNEKEILIKVDFMSINEMCDKILTSSINVTSDNNFTTYNIMYDIRNLNDTCIVNTPDRMYNLVILNLNIIDDAEKNFTFSVHSKENNLTYFLCNKECDCIINDKTIVYHNTLKVNRKVKCFNNEDRKMHSINNSEHNKSFTNIENMSSSKLGERMNVCCVNNRMYWTNTDENSTSKAEISKINFTFKDCNFVFSGGNTDSCIVMVYEKDVKSTPSIQKVMKTFITENEKYFKASNINERKVNNLLMKNTMDSILEHANNGIPIPRAYSSTRDIILYTTVISINEASVEEISSKIIPNNWPNNTTKVKTSFYDLPQLSHSSINYITKVPNNNHRNTQAFKIGEKKCSMNDKIQESMHFHNKQSFPKYDSEIDSKCPSVSSKADSIVYLFFSKNNRSYTFSKNIHTFTNLGLKIPKHLEYTNPDVVSDITHTYLNTIKSAVVTPTCSKVTMNTVDKTTVEIVSDQSTNVAEPSSMIYMAST